MKKSRIIAAFLLFTLSFPVVRAAANSELIKPCANMFVYKYANGNKSEGIILNDIRQKSDDYSVINSIEEVEKQIQSNNNEIDELEKRLFTYDTPSDGMYKCLNSLNYRKIYGYELSSKLGLYKMQNSLNELYMRYSPYIIGQQKEQLEYEGYRLLQEITVNESKLDYLKKAEEQKSREAEVMRDKFETGYATETSLLTAEAALKSAEGDKAICINEITQLKNRYELYSRATYEEFAEEKNFEKKYNVSEYLEKFRQKGFYARYCYGQADCYSNYSVTLYDFINEMDIIHEELTLLYPSENEEICKANMDNIDNFERIYQYIAAEAVFYRNEAEIMRNNAEQYEISLELYVKQLCGGLEASYIVMDAKAAEVNSAENQFVISQDLLAEGRITETKLMELESTVYKLRYELVAAEAEILCSQYVLDNLIESSL